MKGIEWLDILRGVKTGDNLTAYEQLSGNIGDLLGSLATKLLRHDHELGDNAVEWVRLSSHRIPCFYHHMMKPINLRPVLLKVLVACAVVL